MQRYYKVNRNLISVVAAAILIGVVPCPGSSNSEKSAVAILEQLKATYKVLRELRTSAELDQEEYESLQTSVRGLKTEYILMRLNSDGPPAPALFEHELNETFALALGKPLEHFRKYWGDVKFASVVASKDPRMKLYVVGFEYGSASNVILGFVSTPEGYRLAAEGGQELQGHELRLVQLKSFDAEEIRFLAFGKRIGATKSNISVVVYRFDGETITPLWRRHLLPKGKVALKDGEVVLEYLDRQRSEKRTPPYFVVEIYERTKEGLKLLSSEP